MRTTSTECRCKNCGALLAKRDRRAKRSWWKALRTVCSPPWSATCSVDGHLQERRARRIAAYDVTRDVMTKDAPSA